MHKVMYFEKRKNMKKIFRKSNIFAFILGAIIFGGIGVVSAAYTIYANNIEFTPSNSSWKKANGDNITNVKDAIDDMYDKFTANTASELKKVCTYVDNTYSKDKNDKYSIGTKYECDPGDGVKRNFYILEVRKNGLDLLMDKNITQGSSQTKIIWGEAIKYVDNNLKTTWQSVANISLPSAQQIANAVGNTNFDGATATRSSSFCFDEMFTNACAGSSHALKNDTYIAKNKWLFNYTKSCAESGCDSETSLSGDEAWGYWTSTIIKEYYDNSLWSWRVHSDGNMTSSKISDLSRGVRPVITVYRSNLQ